MPNRTDTLPGLVPADHDDDLRQRPEKALEIVAVLLGTDGVLVAPLVDTYRLHAAEVGRVTVRAASTRSPPRPPVSTPCWTGVDSPATCVSRSCPR